MAGTRDRRGVAALAAVALIWGGALSASSAALEGIAAVQQVALRFAVAALTLAAALPGARRKVTRATLTRGLGLGILLATGFLLQTCALQTTPVVTSAFLTGTVVVFAPVIAMLWGGAGLSGHAVTGVLLATTGLALITLRGVGVGVGEAMTLAAALAWAVHLVALQRWGRPGEALPLALIQVASVATLAWTLAAFQGSALSVPQSAGYAVLVAGLGAVGTAAALVLLTWAQARVDATTAAVVLTLEPVFGATCAWAILGESLTPTVALGATAVVTATLLTVWDVPRQRALTTRRTHTSPMTGPCDRRRDHLPTLMARGNETCQTAAGTGSDNLLPGRGRSDRGDRARLGLVAIRSLLEDDHQDVDPADHHQRDRGAGQCATAESADPHGPVDDPAEASHESCQKQPRKGPFCIPALRSHHRAERGEDPGRDPRNDN